MSESETMTLPTGLRFHSFSSPVLLWSWQWWADRQPDAALTGEPELRKSICHYFGTGLDGKPKVIVHERVHPREVGAQERVTVSREEARKRHP